MRSSQLSDFARELRKSITGTDWYKKREATQERYESGEIGDIRRGLSNVGDSVQALVSPVYDTVAAAGQYSFEALPKSAQEGMLTARDAIGRGVNEIAENDTAVKRLSALKKEYPAPFEVAEDIGNIASLAPIVKAPSILKSGLNESAQAMKTMIPENYSGGKLGELYGSTKALAQAAPSAIKSAFSPSDQAYLRKTGLQPSKARGEIGEAVTTGNQSYGAALTAGVLSRQTDRGPSIVERGPIGASNFHTHHKASDTDSLKDSLFVSNKETRGSVPPQVQERALNHLIASTGIGSKLDTTDVGIKRNRGYDNSGKESLIGGIPAAPNPIMSALNSKASLKGSLSEWVKTNKVPRGQKANEDVVEKARKTLTEDDMVEYFNYYNKTHPNKTPVTFRKGEGKDPFYYFQTAHNSRAKELGGVNTFIALNPKSGQVITMVTDKHDLMKFDPVGGSSYVTAYPAQISNFKADRGSRYKLNDKTKEKLKAERTAEEERTAKLTEKETGVSRNKGETAVNYHMRAIKEYKPKAEAQDYIRTGNRQGMLVGAGSGLQGEEEQGGR
jgi:hypothetical protein